MGMESLESIAKYHIDPVALVFKGIATACLLASLYLGYQGATKLGEECDKLNDRRHYIGMRYRCADNDSEACATRLVCDYIENK